MVSTRHTTLTDRYVWTVTRHLSADIGPDVAQELRATIDDAVDDKVAAGLDGEAAEREAISELGDPDVLARQYGGRPSYLIGPGLYPDWVRLLRVLFPIVLPLVLVANFVARASISDEGWGQLLLEAFLLVLSVAVHLAFWVTVTFAAIEWSRPEKDRHRPLTPWQPDQLTTEVPGAGASRGETIFEVLLGLGMAALVLWQFTGVGEGGIQVLDPGLGIGWKAALVGFFLMDAALALAVWRAGRWTAGLAALNVANNAAAVTVTLWLLEQGDLLTDIPEVFADQFGWSADWTFPTGLFGVVIVVIAAWDAFEAIRKARRGGVAQTRP